MTFTPLPSMRIIYFSNQSSEVVNAVIEGLEALGQRVLLLVTTPELLALPRLGCVNTHPSLLPRYRGPNPLFWQFMNGETQGGLTMHRMDVDFDTGPILVQRAIEIAPDDDVDNFFPKLLAIGQPMIPEMLQAVAAGVSGTALHRCGALVGLDAPGRASAQPGARLGQPGCHGNHRWSNVPGVSCTYRCFHCKYATWRVTRTHRYHLAGSNRGGCAAHRKF